MEWVDNIRRLDDFKSRGYLNVLQGFKTEYFCSLMNLDDCWGQNFDPKEPSTKVYRNKCCIACQPGEYLDPKTNSCVNCEAGYACISTLRKISQNLNIDRYNFRKRNST